MKPAKQFSAILLLVVFGFSATVGRADVMLGLNKTFVDQVKNKATVVTNLHVDAHPNSPHAIKSSGNDGDIHMAGRDSLFRLPLVAEIMNARLESAAMKLLKDTTPEQPVSVTGVWRIWFEHLGDEDQIQGKNVPAPTTSNPDHLCEIHPITNFAGADVLNSFVEIKDGAKVYQAYPASKAFPYYESIDSTIQASNTALTITSGQSKYNYAEFVIELASKPKDVGDGYLVLANVFDKDDVDEEVATNVRMVFVKGTDAANQLLKLPTGDSMHLLGIPRVNLAVVAALASHHGNEAFDHKLPYEMIIAAVLPN